MFPSCVAEVDCSSFVPRLNGIHLETHNNLDSWMMQEKDYLRQFICDLSDLDRDFYHQLLHLFTLSRVRLQRGTDQADELAKLGDQVGRLTTELLTALKERDQLVGDASKDVEPHRVHVVKATKDDADAAAIVAHEMVLASLMLGFEQHLAELKEDSNTQGKVLKCVGLWKFYVHGQAKCALAHPTLGDVIVPWTKLEWDEWKETCGPHYQLPVDMNDGEEENLEAEFTDITAPTPLLQIRS